jgi:hypothetical protein
MRQSRFLFASPLPFRFQGDSNVVDGAEVCWTKRCKRWEKKTYVIFGTKLSFLVLTSPNPRSKLLLQKDGGAFMDYDRIILEMLNRIKALEDDVAKLKSNQNVVPTVESAPENPATGKKYRALSDYLVNAARDEIQLTFSEIEQILGFKLPSSAREHRAFWANTTTHSIALSWLNCGFETEVVDMSSGTITFGKKRGTRIADLMATLVADIIDTRGFGCEISSQEIRQLMKARFGTNPGSVLPADFCYNRVNLDSRFLKNPTLFEYIAESGLYKCLGAYPYNGDIYHRPKGEKEDIKVGVCENGKRRFFEEYSDAFQRG